MLEGIEVDIQAKVVCLAIRIKRCFILKNIYMYIVDVNVAGPLTVNSGQMSLPQLRYLAVEKIVNT